MDVELLEAELTRDEGKRNRSYRDTVGKWSIGVGRNLTDVGLSNQERAALLANDPKRSLAYPTLVLTDAEIAMLLRNDVEKAIAALHQFLSWTLQLDEVRQRVVANMCFNMGVKTLLMFKNTLSLIRIGKYDDAATAMLQSKWAQQVGQRAVRLARMMRDGG